MNATDPNASRTKSSHHDRMVDFLEGAMRASACRTLLRARVAGHGGHSIQHPIDRLQMHLARDGGDATVAPFDRPEHRPLPSSPSDGEVQR